MFSWADNEFEANFQNFYFDSSNNHAETLTRAFSVQKIPKDYVFLHYIFKIYNADFKAVNFGSITVTDMHDTYSLVKDDTTSRDLQHSVRHFLGMFSI